MSYAQHIIYYFESLISCGEIDSGYIRNLCELGSRIVYDILVSQVIYLEGTHTLEEREDRDYTRR